ncbi:unnamed protein product [Symbiodinium sp. CCMP2592]|nr:unnamed protein product [Symbiodinium sp. CCMP2592]
MDDVWLRRAMENTSVDGIFGVCTPGILTDFFAVRPQAVDYKLVDACSGRFGAEKHFTCAIGNVLRSRRFTWVEGGEDKVCRMVGARSPVVHVHGFSRCCPDYLSPQASWTTCFNFAKQPARQYYRCCCLQLLLELVLVGAAGDGAGSAAASVAAAGYSSRRYWLLLLRLFLLQIVQSLLLQLLRRRPRRRRLLLSLPSLL